MPLIVGIHGIAQQYRGEHTLAASWLPALRDGLARAGGGAPLEASDFMIAFYGDLFRPPGATRAVTLSYEASDVTDPWEQELLAAWWVEAARVDEGVQPPDTRGRARTPQFVHRALEALSGSRFFVDLTERALIGELKQVSAYIHDEDIRAAVQSRIAACIGDDTRLVIGHSLGSVVAYEALAAHPEWPARTFVTLGSPLGIRQLIFERLRPPPVGGRGIWPGSVERWINIADAGDVVALNKRLSTLFGDRVADEVVHNGVQAHDIAPYLTAVETGRAVAAGLRS